MTDQAPEPTMEEILASIRRIISEDEAPEASGESQDAPAPAEPISALADEAPAPEAVEAEDDEDILELTDLAPEADPLSSFEQAAEPAGLVETLGDLDAYIAPAPKPAPAPAPAPASRATPSLSESLVAPAAAASVSSAFGQLGNLAMPAAGRSLEDVTRDLLRPLLKEWLDQNLQRIVEAKVAEEVERLSRQYR